MRTLDLLVSCHVRGQIARHKVPDYIDFVAELPKTFTGKIQKQDYRIRTSATLDVDRETTPFL